MNTGFTSIPFKAESDSGFSSVNGVAKISAAGIVFEFEKKVLGFIGGGIKELKLPASEILDIKIKSGFFRFSGKVEVKVRSLMTISGLPISDGKLILKIAKDDVAECQEAAKGLLTAIKDMNRELPPVHTPVSRLFDESEDETKKLTD